MTAAPALEERRAEPRRRRILVSLRHATTILAVVIPPAGILSAIGVFWGVGVGVVDVVLLFSGYVLTVSGVTVGLHRYFSHRSFKTSKPVEAALAILGSMAVQGTVTGWVAEHRKHHALSDKEGDPHSPWTPRGKGPLGKLGGLWHAHIGWFFTTKALDPRERFARDWIDDPLVRTLDLLYPVWIVLTLGIPFGIGYAFGGVGGGVEALVWGGLIRVFVVHHLTWSVNSIGHMYGKQAYRSRDESRNTPFLVLPSLGDAYHNNHHAFPSSAIHGFDPGQVDLSGLVIRGLERLGLVWDVKRPDPQQLERRRIAAAG